MGQVTGIGPSVQGRASKTLAGQLSKHNEIYPQVLYESEMGHRGKMKTKDIRRKWMWMFLATVVLLQVYFVQELLAAFALFTLGFAAIAAVFASLYMLHKGWTVAVERIADSRHPVMVAARQGIYNVEDLARRPFRRPGSAAAR
jgi:hypothetical protein